MYSPVLQKGNRNYAFSPSKLYFVLYNVICLSKPLLLFHDTKSEISIQLYTCSDFFDLDVDVVTLNISSIHYVQ